MVVSGEPNPPYPRPPLSKHLWFQPMTAEAQRIFFYPAQVYKTPNTQLLLNTVATVCGGSASLHPGTMRNGPACSRAWCARGV